VPYLLILVNLIPAYLVSRLMLFLLSWWNGGVWRLLAANAITLLIFVLIAGYNAPIEPASGDWQARMALIPSEAVRFLIMYAPSQAILFAADCLRYRFRKRAIARAA
jgi:hypothetical protein